MVADGRGEIVLQHLDERVERPRHTRYLFAVSTQMQARENVAGYGGEEGGERNAEMDTANETLRRRTDTRLARYGFHP